MYTLYSSYLSGDQTLLVQIMSNKSIIDNSPFAELIGRPDNSYFSFDFNLPLRIVVIIVILAVVIVGLIIFSIFRRKKNEKVEHIDASGTSSFVE